jgi:quinol-cytochrome oxidoreductase complex cytochrome b subunit
MPDWYFHYIYLILGIISFSGGVVSTCIGKTWAPHAGRTIDRAKEPSTFWWLVAMYYLSAVLFVGRYLYERP